MKKYSIDNFSIVSTIHSGEKTEVLLVYSEELDEFAILKKTTSILNEELIQSLAGLEKGCIPHIFDYRKENGVLFILEEYIEGKNLAEIIEEGDISEGKAIEIISHLCESVAVLHNNSPSIIHRDLKPSNIMVTKDGRIVLIDFDTARYYRDDTNKDTVVLGTKEYASPEQYGFSQTDSRSDIYSLGIVLDEVINAVNDGGKLKKRARRIVAKATMFSPDMRYLCVEGLKRDVERLRRKEMTPLQKILLLCILSVAAVIIFTYLSKNENPNKTTVQDRILSSEADMDETYRENLKETSENDETPAHEMRDDWNYEYVSIFDEYLSVESYIYDIPELYSMGAVEDPMECGFYTDKQETVMGNGYEVVRFFRGSPFDIKMIDPRYCDTVFREIVVSRYDDEKEEFFEVPSSSSTELFEKEYQDTYVLKKEALENLEAGNYLIHMMFGKGTGEYHCLYYLVVHDANEDVSRFVPRAFASCQYYSGKKNNDIHIFVGNTASDICEIECDGKAMPEDCYIVKDGRELFIKGDFFAEFSDLLYTDIYISNVAGKKIQCRIINLDTVLSEEWDK